MGLWVIYNQEDTLYASQRYIIIVHIIPILAYLALRSNLWDRSENTNGKACCRQPVLSDLAGNLAAVALLTRFWLESSERPYPDPEVVKASSTSSLVVR